MIEIKKAHVLSELYGTYRYNYPTTAIILNFEMLVYYILG
jgi:hypothetical protein